MSVVAHVSRALLVLVVLWAAATSAQAAKEEPQALIERLGGEAINILSQPGASKAEQKAKFEELFRKGFDIPLLGQIVLGRYWRVATPAQREEYLDLFYRYIVDTYSKRLDAYTGQKFRVTGTTQLNAEETLVKSLIDDPKGPGLKVDWRVIQDNGESKIVDVVVEGVSMAISHRSEFASVINQNGGQIELLLDKLRQQTSTQ